MNGSVSVIKSTGKNILRTRTGFKTFHRKNLDVDENDFKSNLCNELTGFPAFARQTLKYVQDSHPEGHFLSLGSLDERPLWRKNDHRVEITENKELQSNKSQHSISKIPESFRSRVGI